MPKVTKAQHAKWEKLQAAVSATRERIYASAPRPDATFSKCLTLCGKEARSAHADALGALGEFEDLLIAQRRAYRAHGLVFTY